MTTNKRIFLPLNSIDENRLSSEKYNDFIRCIKEVEFIEERFKIHQSLNNLSFLPTNIKRKITKYALSSKIYNSNNFDIIHILEQSNLYIVKHFLTKNIYATIHDIIPVLAHRKKIEGFSYPNNPIFFKYNLKQLKYVNKIIAVSNRTRLDLFDHFQDENLDINVIHNPVNPLIKKIEREELEKFYRIENINPDTDKIIIVGLSKIKNISFSLKIFERLLINFPKLELHLVGSFYCINQSDGFVIQNYPKNIFLHQNVDDIKLSYLYSMSKILLFPSYYEGFGLPLVEAMTCGAVVVTSDRGSIPEIVDDAGLIINLNDMDLFVNRITELLINNEYYENFKHLGLNRSKFFSIENFINKHILLYNE